MEGDPYSPPASNDLTEAVTRGTSADILPQDDDEEDDCGGKGQEPRRPERLSY